MDRRIMIIRKNEAIYKVNSNNAIVTLSNIEYLKTLWMT